MYSLLTLCEPSKTNLLENQRWIDPDGAVGRLSAGRGCSFCALCPPSRHMVNFEHTGMNDDRKARREAYRQKLKDPRWQKKRLEVFQRDNFTCCYCGEWEETLHVHHLRYHQGLEPWDYNFDDLLTICETCPLIRISRTKHGRASVT